jgi:hypothetical protein
LRVVLDTADIGAACCLHPLRIVMSCLFLNTSKYPAIV